jgi:hypothetical protein
MEKYIPCSFGMAHAPVIWCLVVCLIVLIDHLIVIVGVQ